MQSARGAFDHMYITAERNQCSSRTLCHSPNPLSSIQPETKMKFLFSTFSSLGHVNPFSAIATELVSRGHQVRWLCGPRFRDRISATGAHFIPWSSPICDADITPGKPDAGTSGMAASVSLARVIFVDPTVEQVEDYRRALRGFAADAMIVDMFGFGPMMFGEMRGPRYVTMSLQPRINFDHPDLPAGQEQGDYWGSPAFMEEFRPLVNAARARLGLSPLPGTFRFLDAMTSPYLHLMQTTTAFEPADRIHMPQLRSVGPMQPMPAIDFTTPEWWAELISRKYFVVHVTQGTYSGNSTDSESLIRPTIRALEHEDCFVVVTVPTGDTEAFFAKTLPANVRVEQFIPHTVLLPFVDLMITNAGYNGVLAALSHGIPLICAGISEDKADMSALAAQSGAGIDLKTGRPTEAQIHDAVKTIRHDPKYAREAKRIQDDFASHDSAVESCDLIENLVKSNRPHSTP